MLEDARNGVINLILVKDLSRLGRDYVEVSELSLSLTAGISRPRKSP